MNFFTYNLKECTPPSCPLCSAGIVRKVAVPIYDRATFESKILFISESLYEKMRLACRPEPQPVPEKKTQTLAEFVRDNGFESEQEFHKMVASVDLSKPNTLRRFRHWQDTNPTKSALQQLLNQES